jgi:hypothetical protein
MNGNQSRALCDVCTKIFSMKFDVLVAYIAGSEIRAGLSYHKEEQASIKSSENAYGRKLKAITAFSPD